MMKHVGERIREVRKVRKMSVKQLADAVAISVSTLQKYENGQRVVPPAMLTHLARALRVGPTHLTGQPYINGAETEEQAQAVIPELRRVLLTYDNPDDLPIPARPLPVLAAETEAVSALRRDSKYVPMGPLLPGLLSELTHTALNGDTATARRPGAPIEPAQREAFRHLAICYRAVNSLAHKLGYHDLSLTAVERVQWAADCSGDPLMQATAGYLKAGAMVRMGSYSSARRLLRGLMDEVERMAPERSLTDAHLAVIGSMLLKLAILEVRDGYEGRAQDWLAAARSYAGRLPGDSLHYETSFGPSNVKIHEVAMLIDSGDTEQALARVRQWGAEQDKEEWEPPTDLARERSSHHYIDVAAAKLATGDRAGSYQDLTRARQLAPHHTRFHPTVRSTAATLVRLDRAQDDTLAGFARWAGV
ncbi:helix-turn-helix transcriptional regulator [Streptomyces sp. AV19]|uniref:helix-turn-helix domain-containing protein n=1 Tax=Streptomyces sp. AV19 TaxID=2793068 RepID=UPI0018FE5412|nr:helix-turn-helix transcriptional regulator [Streptomyces sp. AV19]MBH1938634.1 helix-turn-helix transcriptional regulator [Streptomyces sp. AV19]MDG4535346.1 helix-turn-helix domain-containing protein [Streptomyces sp. AV19]